MGPLRKYYVGPRLAQETSPGTLLLKGHGSQEALQRRSAPLGDSFEEKMTPRQTCIGENSSFEYSTSMETSLDILHSTGMLTLNLLTQRLHGDEAFRTGWEILEGVTGWTYHVYRYCCLVTIQANQPPEWRSLHYF
jgi:hypothetical protein